MIDWIFLFIRKALSRVSSKAYGDSGINMISSFLVSREPNINRWKILLENEMFVNQNLFSTSYTYIIKFEYCYKDFDGFGSFEGDGYNTKTHFSLSAFVFNFKT